MDNGNDPSAPTCIPYLEVKFLPDEKQYNIYVRQHYYR